FTSELKSPKIVSSLAGLISDAKQALLTPKDLELVASSNLDFIAKASEVTKPLTNDIRRAAVKAVDAFSKLAVEAGDNKLPGSVESLQSLWNRDLESAIEQTIESKKATSLSAWKLKYLTRDEEDQQIAKGQLQNTRLKELSSLYAQYLEYLKANNLYDYDDMILLAIEAMKKNSDLRFSLQERYLYIMLDEYQDTNEAQAKLTYLLTDNEIYEGQPNIMAVGDDDQAIYAFQGAKRSNMLDFVDRYKDVKQITLADNYRSGQTLIDLSAGVADQISERLSKMLNVNKSFKASRKVPSKIKSLDFNNEIDEYAWLAENIKADKSKTIAVIAPEHKYLERASAYLIEAGIPISYERRENVLDDPLIDSIVNILKLLKAINDNDSRLTDSLLAITLNYDFWQLPTELIMRLSWQAYDEREPWLKLVLDQPKTRNIGLMLVKIAANALVYRYDFIIDQIIGLSDIVVNDPKFKAGRSPLLSYFEDSNDSLSTVKLLQNLMVLKQQFKDFNGDNDRPLMINDLADFIDQLKSSNIKLTNDFNYGQDGSKVSLMTAHGVKGLEFDSVYLLSFINEVWGSKSNFNRLGLPANLEYIRHGAEDREDESLRLLYVALTRAKDDLTLLSYKQDLNAKPTTPLKYLDLPVTNVEVKNKPSLIPLWQQDLMAASVPTDLRSMLSKRLQSYSLNPTELNTFLDIRNAGPQSFYRSVLLRYRTPVSPRVDYGSAVHDSLDWLQQTLSSSAKLPTLSQLITEFEKSLLKRRLLTHDFERLKVQGIKSLTAYYQENKGSFSKDDLSEYSFKADGISLGKVRISGKID
ncbi:MAG TPA: ATP-dependent helicase, partial [Candidatus Saccharimonadales bacterium]